MPDLSKSEKWDFIAVTIAAKWYVYTVYCSSEVDRFHLQPVSTNVNMK